MDWKDRRGGKQGNGLQKRWKERIPNDGFTSIV